MSGRPFYVRDKGVYDLNDTYLTTTAKYHRRFKHKELDGVAKKDIPTYWETEEYPKAQTWGFGLHHKWESRYCYFVLLQILHDLIQ